MAYPKTLGAKAPWTADDSAVLRQFMSTVQGQRFLAKLYSLRPRATEKTDIHKRAIQSGVSEGFEELYHTIDFLGTPKSYDPALPAK